MSMFKIGDRVRLINAGGDYGSYAKVGDLGTVTHVSLRNGCIRVRFDNGTTTERFDWRFDKAPASAPSPAHPFKIGDRVRLTSADGDYRSSAKAGDLGVVVLTGRTASRRTNRAGADGDALTRVRMDDGTETVRYAHRFEKAETFKVGDKVRIVKDGAYKVFDFEKTRPEEPISLYLGEKGPLPVEAEVVHTDAMPDATGQVLRVRLASGGTKVLRPCQIEKVEAPALKPGDVVKRVGPHFYRDGEPRVDAFGITPSRPYGESREGWLAEVLTAYPDRVRVRWFAAGGTSVIARSSLAKTTLDLRVGDKVTGYDGKTGTLVKIEHEAVNGVEVAWTTGLNAGRTLRATLCRLSKAPAYKIEGVEVYVTGDTAGFFHNFATGTRVRIVGRDNGKSVLAVAVEGPDFVEGRFVAHADLSIHAPKVAKFKVGDRVKVRYMTGGRDTGTVEKVIESNGAFYYEAKIPGRFDTYPGTFFERDLSLAPKPVEPKGLGAVVEDADGLKWLRVSPLAGPSWAPVGHVGVVRRWRAFADVEAVEVLSQGVK